LSSQYSGANSFNADPALHYDEDDDEDEEDDDFIIDGMSK
jgi:hypothetical protein